MFLLVKLLVCQSGLEAKHDTYNIEINADDNEDDEFVSEMHESKIPCPGGGGGDDDKIDKDDESNTDLLENNSDNDNSHGDEDNGSDDDDDDDDDIKEKDEEDRMEKRGTI
ncbi:hypothetical protein ElyMa_001375300 [Elysia marginata]|uniref:Uncharacterized protein n=1 Tax=Elysia marginata TaxID=1093978 RepID=A0AAV4ITI8_9GAST|nr:hypothetical protein ElyMa_001375300 [Elysia marginata]